MHAGIHGQCEEICRYEPLFSVLDELGRTGVYEPRFKIKNTGTKASPSKDRGFYPVGTITGKIIV